MLLVLNTEYIFFKDYNIMCLFINTNKIKAKLINTAVFILSEPWLILTTYSSFTNYHNWINV